METIRTGGFTFDELALKLFELQYTFNAVYRQYVDLIYTRKPAVGQVQDIPFLPIQFFKSYPVQTGQFKPQVTFSSSGTTGQIRSRHAIRDTSWYHYIARSCFNDAFDPWSVRETVHLAVLPNYAENKDSSLLYMVDHFMAESSGLYFHSKPRELMHYLEVNPDRKIAIWGVSFALYQWPERLYCPPGTLVIETGGMKGRSAEITRLELHENLGQQFLRARITSEYGMTELLSQAYAVRDGIFENKFTLKALPRKINDPLSMEVPGQQAVLNFIDLANLDSCAFIATEDLGKVYRNGRFEVLGRLDHSDIRGCNLMVS